LGIRIFHGGAGEARFGLASARATVTVDRVAIVAHFAVGGVDVAVAARRAASYRSAGRIATDGLFGAGLGATGTIAKKQAVLVGVVATFAGFYHAVATLGLRARAGRPRTGPTGLRQTGARATVIAHGIAVVAILASGDDSVTTQGHTRLARNPALPSWLDRRAICRTAVAVRRVHVIAGLDARQRPIAANDSADAELSWSGALEVLFDLTSLSAAVAAHVIAVVAVLTLLQLAITARFGDHRDATRGLGGGSSSRRRSVTATAAAVRTLDLRPLLARRATRKKGKRGCEADAEKGMKMDGWRHDAL